MHPGLIRLIALGTVFGGWAATVVGGYLRGLKQTEGSDHKNDVS